VLYAFCAIAAAIGFAGGHALKRQSLFWAIGLLIGALAAIAYAGATAGSELAFKLYYALGASMLPGWIGAGSLYAVFNRRLARWPAAVVLVLSALQLVLTITAAVNRAALSSLNGTNGEGVLVFGPWVLPTVLFNTLGLGFAAVAAFFAWWRAFRVQRPDHAALAVGLSVVVLGVLARSAASYRMLSAAGAPEAFMLLDALAFALIWAGATLCRGLPKPLRSLLGAPAPVPSP
jgi:hypothetical protein